MVELESDLHVAGSAADLEQALELLRRQTFDLAVVDISLARVSGLEVVRRLVDCYPTTRVLVLTMHDEALYWERAMAAGAHGYVMKSEAPICLIKAIRTVMMGAMYYSEKVQARLAMLARESRRSASATPIDSLSDRELDILRLVGRGKGTSQIAHELRRSVKTIETHKANLRAKLGLQSSLELANFALRWAIEAGGERADLPNPPSPPSLLQRPADPAAERADLEAP
jgi:DNA-binding NarL/FixJ family response regulator